MEVSSVNDLRLYLLMVREHLSGRQSGIDSLRSLRRWLYWQGLEEQARLAKTFEYLGIQTHWELRRALSTGQIESKLWLVDVLGGILPRDRDYRFTVVGGWLGLLPYMLHSFHPRLVSHIQQLDINPEANRIALAINTPLGDKFAALDKDALAYDYEDCPDVIVNTSCEHFTADELKFWLKRLPPGRVVVLQSNNFYNEPGHINCHYSVFKFRKSLDLQTFLYTGDMEFEKYRRFMVIGITPPAN